ncbi:SET domain-containing protein SmydA-8 isoform X1 [Drosophila novamexicana]|uniref:SET domain-containing protein SmydA-8 isoform X1 n=2 Tax=Drosophila novamexicana TaxID=47314 RepID=UPI0011E5EC30|nr:SET domain-containing protein SmydA-8 isoform X1 [Drosophila novamexicana]
MAAVTEDFAKKCEVKQNETLGRYVVAATNIKAGETVLLEQPVLLLANNGDRRCCNCHQLTSSFCGKCRLMPLCADCVEHHGPDCRRLSELQLQEQQVEQLQAHTEVCSALKYLLLREHAEKRSHYEQLLQLEAHLARRRDTDIWRSYRTEVIEPLQASGLLLQLRNGAEIDEELLQRLLAIADINGFEIRAPESGGAMRGVYMTAALFAHSCLPNLGTAVDEQQRIKLYANRIIAAGEILYNCYTDIMLGTDERRRILKTGKCFDCECARCTDPTELGTHMSSFVCSHCTGGYIVRQPETGLWQCLLNAEHTLKPEFVVNVLERAKEEVFHAREDIYRLELLLAKLGRLLHGNHYIMLDLKQNIASILRQILQNMAHRPNRKVYERKIRLCQEILLVLKVVAPGISRLKAIALYELANTQAELGRKLYSEQEHDAADLLAELQQIEIMTRESLRMLLYEPISTPEGQLARNMLRELKELQNDMKMLQQPNDDVVI